MESEQQQIRPQICQIFDVRRNLLRGGAVLRNQNHDHRRVLIAVAGGMHDECAMQYCWMRLHGEKKKIVKTRS